VFSYEPTLFNQLRHSIHAAGRINNRVQFVAFHHYSSNPEFPFFYQNDAIPRFYSTGSVLDLPRYLGLDLSDDFSV